MYRIILINIYLDMFSAQCSCTVTINIYPTNQCKNLRHKPAGIHRKRNKSHAKSELLEQLSWIYYCYSLTAYVKISKENKPYIVHRKCS